MYVCTYVHVYVCVCVCMYVCTHVCICMCKQTYYNTVKPLQLSLCQVKHHSTMTYDGLKVWCHKVEFSPSFPGCFSQKTWRHQHCCIGSQSGCSDGEKILCSYWELNPSHLTHSLITKLDHFCTQDYNTSNKK